MTFESALKFALRWEGGYVDHPSDPGGATNQGITQKTYDHWLRYKGRSGNNVALVTDSEVHEIYRELYWNLIPGIEECEAALQLALFDTAVNFGVSNAVCFLQDALKLKADGILGTQTRSAIARSNQIELAKAIARERLDYRDLRVRQQPSQQVFLKGWINRDRALIEAIEAIAKESKPMQLRTTKDTIFKRSTAQAITLPESEKVAIAAGRTFELHSHAEADANHVRVAFAKEAINGFNTWHVFKGHVEISGKEPANNPQYRAPLPAASPQLRLPTGLVVLLNSPIHPGGNFTWAEATHNGARVPETAQVVYRIQAIAEVLEWVRYKLGDRPIVITSWYRPPAVNRAVGGVSDSRHILGDAVDFYIDGMSPGVIYSALDGWYGDRGGLAPSHRHGFVHIDRRGYKARWTY